MPQKNKDLNKVPKVNKGVVNNAGKIVNQKIVDTIEKNYMPYAMSVIMSRAIPEIDGFKPSHRKLLYTMYKMGLLGKIRTKSANIVGQTMKLNPHGDSAIYDTMVRLSRGYEALLHPYVDSKGNFGKFYSRDMACAASRYTEAKLDNICEEIFKDIDKDCVNFTCNYDNTLQEPTLLPVSFPSILVNANTGIAVGMASSICPFNLAEVCDTTIKLIKNENHDISSTLIAPDFPGGGYIIYEKDKLQSIYSTGRGGLRIRAKYTYDKQSNCIDIINIPPTTCCELIIDKVIELIKSNKVKEISDIRDETGIDGLKITVDLKRGCNPEKLMAKLYHLTPLEDVFSCNFNVLVDGAPKVLGVKELIKSWVRFRVDCIKRRTAFDLNKKRSKLHLLLGLSKILLDIDKAVNIVRNTKEEVMVVPNLMEGFSIDQQQAEYVAEIKLRNLNKEYILKHVGESDNLKKDIENLSEILKNDEKVYDIIISDLKFISKKYGQARKSEPVYPAEMVQYEQDDNIDDYPVTFFATKDGYFKKITSQSLRMNSEQKMKENDEISQTESGTNTSDLLFFTDKTQVYKSKGYDFSDTKASAMGEYIPANLCFDAYENFLCLAVTSEYNGFMIFFYENGKVSKVSMKSYHTLTNRKKLIKAYSGISKAVKIFYLTEDKEFLITSSAGKMLIFNSNMLSIKTSKDSQGVCVMRLKKGHRIIKAEKYSEDDLPNIKKYRIKNIPAAGIKPRVEDLTGEQLKI
ncbi:MAG: topoisomerase IV [Oscillospiraceae bacterium]|jgi:DNA gyrase subunit A|nr:topoisomerase IV [Oscillospiraceae bacterium]